MKTSARSVMLCALNSAPFVHCKRKKSQIPRTLSLENVKSTIRTTFPDPGGPLKSTAGLSSDRDQARSSFYRIQVVQTTVPIKKSEIAQTFFREYEKYPQNDLPRPRWFVKIDRAALERSRPSVKLNLSDTSGTNDCLRQQQTQTAQASSLSETPVQNTKPAPCACVRNFISYQLVATLPFSN